MTQKNDEHFMGLALKLAAPTEPGRHFLEIISEDPAAVEEDEDEYWNHSLLMLPIYVGIEEPTLPDEMIRQPPVNPPERKDWPARILELYNRARLAKVILAAAQIPSLLLHGVTLQKDSQRSVLQTMLGVWDGDDWLVFDPQTGHKGMPEQFMIWWRGEEDLAGISGAVIRDLQISVKMRPVSSLDLAARRTELRDSFIGRISLLHLPVQTQSVYEVLLLVPFGILVIVILRNFIGLSAFGTFAPVLIALSFRETELLKGILLFMMIVSMGLVFRFYLERLRLLLVPRLAAVVTIVVLLMTAVSLFSNQAGFETGLSVSLFPMVIISLVIERMSIVWEERGAATSIREGLGSLFMAALAYSIISLDVLEYWVTVFPEVNLMVLGLIVALGRYTGFRLTELIRFRQLAVQEKT